MCAPAVAPIMMGASQVMGAVGSHQSAQAQADAQNRAARASYKHKLQIREHNWRQTRNTWEVKKHEYAQGIELDNERAWNAYQQNQEVLNQKITSAMFQRENSAVKMMKAQGKANMVNDNRGQIGSDAVKAFGRENAQRVQMLTDATYATGTANKNIWQQQKDSAMKRHNNVSIAPRLGVAPPPPQMTPGPSGLSLAAGVLGGMATAAGGIMKNQPPKAYTGQQANVPFTPGGESIFPSFTPEMPSFSSQMPNFTYQAPNFNPI